MVPTALEVEISKVPVRFGTIERLGLSPSQGPQGLNPRSIGAFTRAVDNGSPPHSHSPGSDALPTAAVALALPLRIFPS